MARKPSALARELARNFPKGKRRRKSRRGAGNGGPNGKVADPSLEAIEAIDSPETGELIDPSELDDAGMSLVDSPDDE